MSNVRLIYLVLILPLFWTACNSDDIAPNIEILSPTIGTEFTSSSTFNVEAEISDNEELDFVAIALTGPNDELTVRKIELAGRSATIRETFQLDYANDGKITLNINVVDEAENNSAFDQVYDFRLIETGTIDLNIKLEFDGIPLVMFEDYTYPDGRKMNFTRCSFYTSDMKLDERVINEVEFHNLTNDHATADLAESGYTYTIENVLPGNYESLSFNIGVPQELNDKDPGEFPSGHPLAKPAENWFSWKSFIFLKIEGNIDLDDDGEMETGIAIHTGANEALVNIAMSYPVQINANEVTPMNITLDVYDVFKGEERIFPIDDFAQIHSLSQLDAVIELSNNLINAIDKI